MRRPSPLAIARYLLAYALCLAFGVACIYLGCRIADVARIDPSRIARASGYSFALLFILSGALSMLTSAFIKHPE